MSRPKDRVAAIAALSSPVVKRKRQDIDEEPSPVLKRTRLDTEKDVVSVSSIDSSSTASSTASKSRSEFPAHFKKQLAEDIERTGGIQRLIDSKEHLLRKLLNKRPELYQDPAHPWRRKIQLLVLTWKKYHKQGNYAKRILARFQVVPFEYRDKTETETETDETDEPLIPKEVTFQLPISESPTMTVTRSSTQLAGQSAAAQAAGQSAAARAAAARLKKGRHLPMVFFVHPNFNQA